MAGGHGARPSSVRPGTPHEYLDLGPTRTEATRLPRRGGLSASEPSLARSASDAAAEAAASGIPSSNVDADVLARHRRLLRVRAGLQCMRDDCLSEQTVAELIKCIRLNEDCADICLVAGRVANRQTEYDANVTRAVLEACATTCRSCGDECVSATRICTSTAVSAPRRAGVASRPARSSWPPSADR
jgi:hypothetical protein